MTIKEQREEIKRILSCLKESERDMFKRMYDKDSDLDPYEVADEMPAKRVPWALTQCQNTYHNLFKVIKRA